MSTWIYVTNLPLYYDELSVKDIFNGIGQILSIKLAKDQLIHKCTAMVEFSQTKHAKMAASKKDHTVLHHTNNDTHKQHKLGIRVFVIWCPVETVSTVRCYNIDPSCTNIELEKYFNPFGDIVNVQIMDNQIQSKPYALISFSRVDYALRAVQEMNGTMIGLGGALCVELVNVDARNLQWKRHSFEYISLNYQASNALNSIDKLLLSPLHNTSNGKYRTYSIVNTTCNGRRYRSRNRHERMCDIMEMIIYGFIRSAIGRAISRTQCAEVYNEELVLSEVMNVTFYYCYFEARILETEASQLPLYVRDPTVPAPPQRVPPLPPKKPIKMIKKIVVERSDQKGKSSNKKQQKGLANLTKDAPIFIPSVHAPADKGIKAMAVSKHSVEGKYQQIFDIYRDRLDVMEGKMSVLQEEFESISLSMNRTLVALEQRRINDINTIQKQFNSTITALCYQINNQINNQIKIMSSKMETARKENMDRIDDLEEDLCQMKKENDLLRKKQKINKILKPKSHTQEMLSNQRENDIDKVRQWLTDKVKLAQYLDLFVNNGYDDLESMQDITFSELEQIGINKMGHRKKLAKYAAKLVFIDTRSTRVKHLNRLHKSSSSAVSSASNNTVPGAMSPNSANGSGTTHSSLYSHNIWSDDSVSSMPWTYTQNNQQSHPSNSTL
eukprot:187804_1